MLKVNDQVLCWLITNSFKFVQVFCQLEVHKFWRNCLKCQFWRRSEQCRSLRSFRKYVFLLSLGYWQEKLFIQVLKLFFKVYSFLARIFLLFVKEDILFIAISLIRLMLFQVNNGFLFIYLPILKLVWLDDHCQSLYGYWRVSYHFMLMNFQITFDICIFPIVFWVKFVL